MSNFVARLAGAALLLTACTGGAHAQTAPAVSPEQVQQLIATLKQRNEQVRELSTRLREAEGKANPSDALAARVAAAEKALAVGARKNADLVALGEAILTDYEKMDLGKKIGSREPLTGLYRVKLENKLQEYRDEIAALGFYPEKEMAPAASVAPQP